jgi:hypothetical protein
MFSKAIDQPTICQMVKVFDYRSSKMPKANSFDLEGILNDAQNAIKFRELF